MAGKSKVVDRLMAVGDDRSNVRLQLGTGLPFPSLLGTMRRGFQRSTSFFGGTGVTISFDKEALSVDRRRRLVRIVARAAGLRVVYVVSRSRHGRLVCGETMTRYLSRHRGSSKRFCHKALGQERLLRSRSDVIVLKSIRFKTGMITGKGVVVLNALCKSIRTKTTNSEGTFVVTLSVRPRQLMVKSVRTGHRLVCRSDLSVGKPRVTIISKGEVCLSPLVRWVFKGAWT